MTFKSEKKQRYLFAKKPVVAEKFAREEKREAIKRRLDSANSGGKKR